MQCIIPIARIFIKMKKTNAFLKEDGCNKHKNLSITFDWIVAFSKFKNSHRQLQESHSTQIRGNLMRKVNNNRNPSSPQCSRIEKSVSKLSKN